MERLTKGSERIFQLPNFVCLPFSLASGMLLGGDKHNVTVLVTLVIIIATLRNGFGADVSASGQSKIANNNSALSSGESITVKMLQIRRLVKSLFSDWKLGESDFEGKKNFGSVSWVIDNHITLII